MSLPLHRHTLDRTQSITGTPASVVARLWPETGLWFALTHAGASAILGLPAGALVAGFASCPCEPRGVV